MRYSSDPAGPGQDVHLTGASHSGAPTHNPTGFVHGAGGDYGHNQGGGSDARPYTCHSDSGGAGQDSPVGPPSAIKATGPQPGRRDGPTPCWNEWRDRTHDPGATNALCSEYWTFVFG